MNITMMDPTTVQLLTDFAYIVAIAFFILSLKWLSTPATARRGVLVGEIGAGVGGADHVLQPRARPVPVDSDRPAGGRDRRHSARPGADEGRAAADRHEPRLRRAGGGADRDQRVLPPCPRPHEVPDGRDLDGGHHRLAQLHGQPDRGRQAPGVAPAAPHRLQGAELRQLLGAGGGRRGGAGPVLQPRHSRSSSPRWWSSRCCSA